MLHDYSYSSIIVACSPALDTFCSGKISAGYGTGFGSGTGSGDDPKSKCKGSGGGAGAGIGVVPLGFLVSRGKEISFIAVDKKTALSTLFEKVPDLVEKLAGMKGKQEEKEKKD